MYGKTKIVRCGDYEDVGRTAARDVAVRLRALAEEKKTVRAVFAAGESQGSFLDALAREPGIPWDRIVCFNIDDFWEPRMPAEFSCGRQTSRQLYDIVKPKSANLVDCNAPDPDAEARRFESLLREDPVDVVCQGIGTSGHLALNEPDVSSFDDPAWMRVVHVAEQSKRQLRDDPNFRDLGYIPEKGITMTLSAIRSAPWCYTIVPLGLKKPILTRLAELRVKTPALPASILLEIPGWLYVDENSCPDAWR